jgi:nicotinamide riboside kinase
LSSIKKIVVIGPESTGKSTLSEALANSLQTIWVPEYARTYLENLGREYTEVDLLEIAKGQLAAEDAAMQTANKYLICDTDLYVIKVWSEDIAWTDDPLREHPLPEERQYFYNIYRDIVVQSGCQWADIRGTATERLIAATNAVQKLL